MTVSPCVMCGKPGRSARQNTTCGDSCWKAYKREYDQKHRTESPRVDRSAYFNARKDKKREYDRLYRERNAEKVLESRRLWTRNRTATRPEYARMASAKRRARMMGNGYFQVTEKELAHVAHLYRNLCAYCQSNSIEHWDHVLPIARGGCHSIGNLLPSCQSCNQSKGSRTIMEWKLSKQRLAQAILESSLGRQD